MVNKTEEIRLIFSEAYKKKTSQERMDYLDRTCRNDTDLREEVESLLKAYDSAEGFLEAPILNADVTMDDSPLSETPGTVIDKYKLLEKIGEGGMAVVYMAGQERPIRRKVALKIIKLGMDTKSVIARFEAERQALAMMDHPNIAKVLDAGATETGRPYFVMDLVPGIPITEYCDRNRLSIKKRLKLFISVCSAIQHAHQKGIIHRDIKPSNIIVTQHDGQPVPKVIDFGIAKATNQRLTEKTLFTRHAHIIGTPAYMSPEQAELSDLDVDTRTDIYSLGILLYELLTGSTPFAEKKLREVGYLQMQKIICEEEPTKPSTKLSTLGEALTDVAKWYNCTPESMPKLIRGDLDWIVMKSLEKSRSRRYDTASALSTDIQRHLDNEPVLARAPKVTYRLHKFFRRHRSQTIVTAAIAVLIGTVIIALSMWNRYRLQLSVAQVPVHTNILSEAQQSFVKGDYAVALTSVKTVVDSRHIGIEAKLLCANILVDCGRPDEAKALLEDLLDERAEIAGAAHLLLARILLETEASDSEKFAKIEEHRQKADELLPETAQAYFLRARIAISIREKLEYLNEALRLDRGHYESRRLRAYTYYASRKYEQMEEDALVMTALQSQDPLGYSLRAIALRELGYYEEAIEDYSNAIRLTTVESPQLTELYAQRNEIYLRMGEFEHVIADAKEGLTLFPTETILHFRIFCALIALGNYDEASALYYRIAGSDLDSRRSFRDWSMKYVFDTLDAGRSWHPPDSEPDGAAFLAMLDAEETYHKLTAKAKRLITNGYAADWSPDRTKLAFCMGIPGYSGIAIFDPASQETNLLIAPGMNPKWSPDGRYIAFVRGRQILPLSELVTAELSSEFRSYRGEEIWIMNADGTAPRRLAQGRWPSWSQDSKHVYNQSNTDQMLYSIPVEDRGAQPKPILPFPHGYCSVSPDERYVAYAGIGLLKIVDMASQSLVADWKVPLGLWGGNWSPKGYQFSMGGYLKSDDRTGLWIYDLEKGEAAKILSGQITEASWAPDGTELAFSLGPPFYDIWVAGLDPNISTIDALGPGRTPEEHYQEMTEHYTLIIEADPEDAGSYFSRAQYYHYLNDQEDHDDDMDEYRAILNPQKGTDGYDRWLEAAGDQEGYAGLLFGTPTNLGPTINTPAHESVPSISADGLSLYFQSNRHGGHGRWDLYVTKRATTKDEWEPAVNLGPPVNSSSTEYTPCISADGLELHFGSNRSGGSGRGDIWKTTRKTKDDPWSEPMNLGPIVNSPHGEGASSISTDGLTLFLLSDRPGGFGDVNRWGGPGFDLWVATRETTNDPWSEPVNIGPPVNSALAEEYPHISVDGLTLSFSSGVYSSPRPGGHGGSDIWVAMRKTADADWSEPMNLGPPVNGPFMDRAPRISADGSTLYFCSDRPGGIGTFDLWQVSITPMSGFLQKDDNADLVQKSVESENGKGG
ncbi:protein kinase [Planctomycetota bacterium]